ncbi:hypothetical protein RND81_13G024800 [Saponaria officinalis]|uniref:YDG domain-containing protein n=1 Tax=Saponaria officinalis TaxID=3572 RepID=A0AAW1GXW1_SAPOF
MELENSCSRVTFTRDFPPGCGNLMSPAPALKRFCSYSREYPPGCGPNAPKITSQTYPENSFGKRVNLGPKPSSGPASGPSSGGRIGVNLVKKENIGCKPSLGSGSGSGLGLGSRVGVGLVKRENVGCKPFAGSGSGSGKKVEEGDSKERERVLEMLKLFRKRCDELSRTGVKRVDIEAKTQLSREGKLIGKDGLKFGEISGVEVGDKFYYRVELVIVGLHRLFQGGIDAMESGGDRYATCIVANEGHLDKMGDPNVLSYGGEGGTLKRHEVGVPPDQQLTGGNRALDNSRRSGRPVRVVRGLRYGPGNAKIVYVYDGLYRVVNTVKKKGPQGNMVFEFHMSRNPGQPVVPWREFRRSLA